VQHTIAHVAQVGRTRAEIQIIGLVILAYLQIHRGTPPLLRGDARFDCRERGLGHDPIGQHRDLKGEYRLRLRFADPLRQRGQLRARGGDGSLHPARFFSDAAALARWRRIVIGEHDQPAAREPSRNRRAAQANDRRRITLHCRRRRNRFRPASRARDDE